VPVPALVPLPFVAVFPVVPFVAVPVVFDVPAFVPVVVLFVVPVAVVPVVFVPAVFVVPLTADDSVVPLNVAVALPLASTPVPRAAPVLAVVLVPVVVFVPVVPVPVLLFEVVDVFAVVLAVFVVPVALPLVARNAAASLASMTPSWLVSAALMALLVGLMRTLPSLVTPPPVAKPFVFVVFVPFTLVVDPALAPTAGVPAAVPPPMTAVPLPPPVVYPAGVADVPAAGAAFTFAAAPVVPAAPGVVPGATPMPSRRTPVVAGLSDDVRPSGPITPLGAGAGVGLSIDGTSAPALARS